MLKPILGALALATVSTVATAQPAPQPNPERHKVAPKSGLACTTIRQAAQMHLERQGQEIAAIGAVEGSSREVFVFVNPTTRAWTMAIKLPNGCARRLGFGGDWEWLISEPAPEGEGI